MSVRQITLSNQAKEQLIRLKMRTGIQQWNILCRWAFCVSLREPTPPTPLDIPADSNVEMSWQVFGGDNSELYMALLKERCRLDKCDPTDEAIHKQFRLHLHRGISYLATPNAVKGIEDVIRMTAEVNREPSVK